MREYNSGMGWCFWRWTQVPSDYIRRLHIIKAPWFAVCLHWLMKPDQEPHLHDHPVSFLSLVLFGGYTELRFRKPKRCAYRLLQHNWWNYIRATSRDRHKIVKVKPHTLTLCFMGPKQREWGFWVPDGNGVRNWVHWKVYNKEKYGSKDAQGVCGVQRGQDETARRPVQDQG